MTTGFKAGALLASMVLTSAFGTAAKATDDPYVWLETSASPEAQAWVQGQNDTTLQALTADPRFAPTKALYKVLLTADDRLPDATLQGGYLYNFWHDQAHEKGLWRRVRLDDYTRNPIPWEVILDVDRLAAQEKEDWVWSAAQCLPPAYERCLLSLSRGGKDAVVTREFDVKAKAFVAGGFVLPEAKSNVGWVDADTLFVGTDWGDGTMTSSGYPAEARLWKRGTDWRSATPVYKGSLASVSVGATAYSDASGSLQIVEEDPDFFTAKRWVRAADGALTPLPLPLDSEIQGYFQGSLILRLDSVWTTGSGTYPVGSVVAYDAATGKTTLVYTPDERSTVEDIHTTRDQLVVNILHNVTSQLLSFTRGPNGVWTSAELPVPGQGTIAVTGADAFDAPLLATFQSFLQPPTVYRLDGAGTHDAKMLLQAPSRFDASQLVVEQLEAVSRDGTHVPYFLVHAKDYKLDGKNPTLLYGYGGFKISMTESYSAGLGSAWLAKGGVYALANIRGGGEFGPNWHTAALKHDRQHAYDDFIAVGEDLVRRQVADTRHLGIRGGSNGGLLVGTVMVERPDLFHAVVCEVPLLDMVRFPLLGAGASWEGEYGDPANADDLAAILRYSPYQNLKPGTAYPKPLFVTSTDDDRVTPFHARKLAAKMAANGQPYFFYETAKGGHATPASADDAATTDALEYTYLYQQLFGAP